jgi:hypothetical protein
MAREHDILQWLMVVLLYLACCIDGVIAESE